MFIPGKVIGVDRDYCIIAKGHKLYKFSFTKNRIEYIAEVHNGIYSFFSRFDILRRLTRSEITGMYRLENKYLVVAKKGIFKYSPENNTINKVLNIPRGSKTLNLCVLSNGHVFFGEYFQNVEKSAVHIYGSFDQGDSWQKVFTFQEGNINHIHGVFYDKYTNRIWCLTGDRENECIIGYTEDEFATFHELFRGGQEYRSCQLFFYPEYLVYATDSRYMPNVIKKIDRQTLEITELQAIQGSAIKGGQAGDTAFISTTIEPSEVNKNQYSHVWVTRNGLQWKEVFAAKKDFWPAIMQFGTFEFPQYFSSFDDTLFMSGRALCKVDGCSLKVKIKRIV